MVKVFALVVIRSQTLDAPLTRPDDGITREIDGVPIACDAVSNFDAPAIDAACIWDARGLTSVLSFFNDESQEEMFDVAAEAMRALEELNPP